jgi:hypothetical protein
MFAPWGYLGRWSADGLGAPWVVRAVSGDGLIICGR